jgi:flavin-dependent dehydrogenase
MHHDIIIIGGGPAGISTALHLSQFAPELAARTLVLEKAHYPRPKLCAGALVADAEILLARLGLDVCEIPHMDAESAHFEFEGDGLVMRVPKSHTLRIIRRDEFDAWLATKARERGIVISEGITVEKVTPTETDVLVSTNQGDYHAQVVVGADGSNSTVRRCVLPEAPVYTSRALEVLALPSSDSTHDMKVAYFNFSPLSAGIGGYTWDFPTQLKGRPMRCWGIYDSKVLAKKTRQSLKETLAKTMAGHGVSLDDYELEGYPIRWFHPSKRLAVPRVVLVGDAAGSDSLFGEGISMALGYGRVAARAIKDAFGRRDFLFQDYGRRILFSPLGRTLFIRMIITSIIYNMHWAWFQRLLWWRLKPIVILVARVFVLNWANRMK